jgi:hypothetical protein
MRAARRSPLTIGVLAAELAVGAFVLAPPAAADDGPEPIVAEPAPPATGTAEPPTDVPEPPGPRTGRAGDGSPAAPDTPQPELPVPETPVPQTPVPLPSTGSPTADAPLTALRTGRATDATPAAASPPVDRDTTPATDQAPPGRGTRHRGPSASSDRTATSATVPAPAPGAPPATSAPAAAAPPAHIVATGESLWHIAGAHLAATTGRDRAAVPLAEVAAYWVRVCDANQGTIRSGNLDLIYPGEVVQLPPL